MLTTTPPPPTLHHLNTRLAPDSEDPRSQLLLSTIGRFSRDTVDDEEDVRSAAAFVDAMGLRADDTLRRSWRLDVYMTDSALQSYACLTILALLSNSRHSPCLNSWPSLRMICCSPQPRLLCLSNSASAA